MDIKYKPLPFWSWNDELDEKKLVEQINWMYESGIGGFFMHARGGLTTPYLGDKWFSCVDACLKRAKELGMQAYAYDENGWPSGFAGMKLLELEEDRDCYLEYKIGEYDPNSFVSYDISNEKIERTTSGKNVLNIYCKSSPSTADILNKKTVRKFLDLTHEQYKKADKYGNLQGFFTDEPQYQRWNHPYTHCLEEYFKTNYKEDILDRLGLMFVEKEGYRDFRYKYWSAMQSLMLSSYAEQVYNWCDSNGYKLTGHYVEETSLTMQMENCAGIMPFYEFEHIPGMDWLGREIESDLAPKQLGSVCAQFGKKQILTESFAMVGWDATPEELKHIFEWQASVGSVNLLCHHLLPYSEWGQRKRDYPEHYSNVNPWAYKDFKIFNDKMSEIGEKLATSTEIVNVALLHPIRSSYFNYKRSDPYASIDELNSNIHQVVNKLSGLHIPYHFIDETILRRHGKVDGKSIVVGNCKYDTLILPKIYTMDKYTEKVIHEFINNGGKILLLDNKPTYLEGNLFNYDYLENNITLEEIVKNKPFDSIENANIRINYRIDDRTNEKFYYIVNLGDKTQLKLNNFVFNFDKWESRFIKENELANDVDSDAVVLHLNNSFRVTKPVNNFLTLDNLYYSTDGKNYSQLIHHCGVLDALLKERYKGDLFLKYKFEVKNIPLVCSALIEDQHLKTVTINGKEAKKIGSVLEDRLIEFDIAQNIKNGINEIVVKIDYFQSEDVYYALFGENVTESLINCLAYPTTIEAIYLKGIFGVDGKFSDGETQNVLIGEDFSIVDQKDSVSCLVKDGFPFFRGEIELEQEINIQSANVVLQIPQRFALIKLYINDIYAGEMMFSHKIDISKFVKKGRNTIRLVLTISNRNLLGPFHSQIEEPLGITPNTFERKGNWKDGKSPDYRDSYSFVRTII